MDELVEWLRVQLDDDAELAASGETWTAFEESTQGTRRVDVDHSIERVVACTRSWRGLHIARHDPARVLREIDAKRQILAEHPSALGWNGQAVDGRVCRTCAETSAGELSGDSYPCRTLRLLALPYADRPGYREEWRP